MAPSVEEMFKQYITAWNKTGLAEFKTAFARCRATDATYTDANFALVNGVDGIAELAQVYLDRVPVRTFHVLTSPNYHHNFGHYTWTVDLPERTRVRDGFDYFEFNEENQITRLVSFFGPLR
jgi:hypothetical protein